MTKRLCRALSLLNIAGRIIRPGAALFLSEETARALMVGGHVTTVNTPPLEALSPTWARRAKRLAELEIITVEDLVSRQSAEEIAAIADKMSVKAETVQRWQEEVMELLL